MFQDDFSSDSDADVANELKADYIDEGLDSYSRYVCNFSLVLCVLYIVR